MLAPRYPATSQPEQLSPSHSDATDAVAAATDNLSNTLLQNPYGSSDIVMPVPFVESALESIFGTLAYLYVLAQRAQLAHSTNVVSILLIVFSLYLLLYLLSQFTQSNTTGSVSHLTWLMWFVTRVVTITSAALGLLVFGVLSGWFIDGPHASSFEYVTLLFPLDVCILLFMFLVFVKQSCQTNPATIKAFDLAIHEVLLSYSV